VLKISLRNIVIYAYGVIKNNNNNKGGGWVRAAAAGVRTFPPDMCLPVTVLEKEFTVQTLAAMASAVCTITECRSTACATEVKSYSNNDVIMLL